MNDTVTSGASEAVAPAPPPRLRMDKSRAFATIHGDRTPEDKYASVFFMQDGIPFDAQGYSLLDHPDVLAKLAKGDRDSLKFRAMLEKLLTREAKRLAKNPPKPVVAKSEDDDDDEDDDEDEDDDLLDPIDLKAWLRGDQKVEWGEITQEIARIYKTRKTKIEDAVAFLVNEQGLVPKPQVQQKWQRFCDQ